MNNVLCFIILYFCFPGTHTHVALEEILAEKAEKAKDAEENKLPQEVMIMQPILRFLQLLCENHNYDLQVIFALLYFLIVSIN